MYYTIYNMYMYIYIYIYGNMHLMLATFRRRSSDVAWDLWPAVCGCGLILWPLAAMAVAIMLCGHSVAAL